jgi:alkylation response protein AidB-like acyl-CoA dehydrogenase
VDHQRWHRRRPRGGRHRRPRARSRGQASFIVPPGTPGLSQGQKYKKHGIRASHTAEVVLDDVRIPGSCLLGGKEKLDEKLARAREAKTNPSPSIR